MRLKETEADTKSWNKATIRYVLTNRERLLGLITIYLRMLKNTQTHPDDILDLLLDGLYEKPDYVPQIGKQGQEIGIDVYINKYIKELCSIESKRNLKEASHYVPNYKKTEDSDVEQNVLDNVPDINGHKGIDKVGKDIESALIELEPKRYMYGFDLYDFLYIKLLGDRLRKPIEEQNQLLDLLDIPLKQVTKARYEVTNLVTQSNEERLIHYLEPYVYSREVICKYYRY